MITHYRERQTETFPKLCSSCKYTNYILIGFAINSKLPQHTALCCCEMEYDEKKNTTFKNQQRQISSISLKVVDLNVDQINTNKIIIFYNLEISLSRQLVTSTFPGKSIFLWHIKWNIDTHIQIYTQAYRNI